MRNHIRGALYQFNTIVLLRVLLETDSTIQLLPITRFVHALLTPISATRQKVHPPPPLPTTLHTLHTTFPRLTNQPLPHSHFERRVVLCERQFMFAHNCARESRRRENIKNTHLQLVCIWMTLELCRRRWRRNAFGNGETRSKDSSVVVERNVSPCFQKHETDLSCSQIAWLGGWEGWGEEKSSSQPGSSFVRQPAGERVVCVFKVIKREVDALICRSPLSG